MKILINNKCYKATFIETNRIKILVDESDIPYFYEWQQSCKNNLKADYVRDIPFNKISESGILKNCFLRISDNEDSVDIVFDIIVNYKMDFDRNLNKFVKRNYKVIKFLEAIEGIYKEYNMSISHEDGHGGFILEEFKEFNIEWLKECSVKIKF